MKLNSGKAGVLFLVPVLAVVINLCIVEGLLSWHDRNNYPSSLVLGGVPLAGMSREEAARFWEARVKETWGDSLVLRGPDRVFTIPLAQWNIAYDTDASLKKASDIVDKEAGKNILHHIMLRAKKQELTPVFKWQEKELQMKVMALTLKEIRDKEPENARLYFEKGQGLGFRTEKYGYQVDPVATYHNLASHLKGGIIQNIEIKTVPTAPKVTREKIKAVNTLLNIEAVRAEAVYPSWYELLDEVNGKVVMPGETWLLHEEINTFKPAKYVLKSDREILLKALSNAWQGAGLAVDGYNLVNNSQGPVGITLNIEKGNTMVIRIWGTEASAKKKVVLEQEKKMINPPVVVEIDEKLAPGEKRIKKGIQGEVIYNYKTVFIDGKPAEKVLLWQEIKPGKATVVYYGRGTFVDK